MYVGYVVAIFICPWKILTSATSFLRFLSGYSIFLGPFVEVFLTDYFVVKRGNVRVEELYSNDPRSRYCYIHGVSYRAVVAYIVAVVLPIPGFAVLLGQEVGQAWLRIYEIG